MRTALLLICLAGLAACSSPGPVVQPTVAGGNRADGIVTMSSMASIYQPAEPDLLAAADAAARRCRGWGYRGGAVLAGTRDFCRYYDSWGRCTQTIVTRFYECGG
jgi:putative hemolysin